MFIHIGKLDGEGYAIELMIDIRGSFSTMVYFAFRLFVASFLVPFAWAFRNPILFGVRKKKKNVDISQF